MSGVHCGASSLLLHTLTGLEIWAERWKPVTRCCAPVRKKKKFNSLLTYVQKYGWLRYDLLLTALWWDNRLLAHPPNTNTSPSGPEHAVCHSLKHTAKCQQMSADSKSPLSQTHTEICVRSLGWNLIYKTYLGRSVWLCLKGFHSFLLTEYSQASPETQKTPSWDQWLFLRVICYSRTRASDSLSVSLSVVNPPNKKMWSGDTGVKECQDRPTGPCWGTLLQQGREGHRKMWARYKTQIGECSRVEPERMDCCWCLLGDKMVNIGHSPPPVLNKRYPVN